MSRDEAHPALHTPPSHQHISPHSNIMGNSPELRLHFVPEGWDDFGRGICPCGEVVRWTTETVGPMTPRADGTLALGDVAGHWVPDRMMRVLVLTPTERLAVMDMLALSYGGDVPETRDMVMRQLQLQDEVPSYEEYVVPAVNPYLGGNANLAMAYNDGYNEGLGDIGRTYEGAPLLNEAYDQGRAKRRAEGGLE